jgi:hypothetical protein
MELTKFQKQEFYEEGCLTIEGAVPRVMVDVARQAINAEIGKGESRGFPNIRSAPVITDMFNETPVFSLLESAMGKGNLQEQRNGAAKLNFPAQVGTSQKEPWLATAGPPLRMGGHLDGIAQARDFLRGTAEESKYSRDFTAFAVVYLDDVPGPGCGNFTLWPKSHHVMEEVFKEKGHEILLNYMPDVEVPEGPVQVTGKPGDVVLAHHQMIHTAAINACPDIRYAVIFRAKHVDIEANGKDVMVDIWREWDGIREELQIAG